MAVRNINLPHTKPSSRITYENNFEEVISQIVAPLPKALTKVAQNIVNAAQDTGTYENRTGNLRRLITSNVDRVDDDVKTYQSTEVLVTESDGETSRKKQYHPPPDFDETKVIETADGVEGAVCALMPYAAIREAHGDKVLTDAVLDKALHEGLEVIATEIKREVK